MPRRHVASVLAVLAWDYLDQHHGGGEEGFDPSYGAREAQEALHAGVQDVAPSRPLEENAVLDHPAQALLDASADGRVHPRSAGRCSGVRRRCPARSPRTDPTRGRRRGSPGRGRARRAARPRAADDRSAAFHALHTLGSCGNSDQLTRLGLEPLNGSDRRTPSRVTTARWTSTLPFPAATTAGGRKHPCSEHAGPPAPSTRRLGAVT